MQDDKTILDIKDITRRMEGALQALNTEFSGLRTGRASSALLESVFVDSYGQNTPLNQVASISVPEPRLLSVQVWDKSMVPAVEKAILNANLGLNPVVEGQLLRLPIPPLNEERRAELAKKAGQYAEQGRIAVRNVRRDSMERLKKMEKSGELSEDESRTLAEEVQKLTDNMIRRVDEVLKAKQDDIMRV